MNLSVIIKFMTWILYFYLYKSLSFKHYYMDIILKTVRDWDAFSDRLTRQLK